MYMGNFSDRRSRTARGKLTQCGAAGAATEKLGNRGGEEGGGGKLRRRRRRQKGQLVELWRRRALMASQGVANRPTTGLPTTPPPRTPAFSGTRRPAWSHI
eukprot:gene22618-biopygen22252